MSSTEIVGRLKGMLEEAERALEQVNRGSMEVGTAMQDAGGSKLEEPALVDIGFLFKESSRMLDEARKECDHKVRQVGQLLALLITRRALSTGEEAIAVGELAKAVPDVKMRASLPKAGTAEYAALLRYMGVSEETVKAGLLTPHWTRFCDWLTAAAARGEKIPPGITAMKPDSTVTYRRIRKISNED